MARMPTGTPRSVPDPHGDDYDLMMRQWRASQGALPGGPPLQSSTIGTRPPTSTTSAPVPQAANPSLFDQAGQAFSQWQHSKPIGHPGFAESLIPVWGSGRDAVADLQEGDYPGAALNGALAISDLIPAKAVAGALDKGMWKAGSHTWAATRKWLGKEGYLEAGQHGHHWLIPRNGWGKDVPDWLKNHPWNIKGMPSPEIHGRIHGRYNGPQFNPAQRFWYGTPAWWKATVGEAAGIPAAAGWEASKQQ